MEIDTNKSGYLKTKMQFFFEMIDKKKSIFLHNFSLISFRIKYDLLKLPMELPMYI